MSLERLEQDRPSTDLLRFWQIVTIDSDGNLEHEPGYQFPFCAEERLSSITAPAENS